MGWIIAAIAGLFVLAALAAVGALGVFARRAAAARTLAGPRREGEETFFEALRRAPLGLVITLDILDFLLDFFATPIVWIVLGRMGYGALRQVAAVEALIPFTQPIPLMTICWIIARLTDPSRPRHRPPRKRVRNLATAPLARPAPEGPHQRVASHPLRRRDRRAPQPDPPPAA